MAASFRCILRNAFRLEHTEYALNPLAALPHLPSASATSAAAQEIPSRLADTTYWRLVTELSEPSGYFPSDNLLSNETSLQYVIPELLRTTKPGGVYLGVAPSRTSPISPR